jgi:uncharacterized repeat protein (TIGR01451 family)
MAVAVVAIGVLFGAHQAFALGTLADTDVSNSATVDYTVGTVAQPQETSNIVTFEVDRRILHTVAELGGTSTNVVAGALAQAVTFTVDNDTNDTVDFRLVYTQDGTDDFDATFVNFYLDDGDNVFDGGDAVITFLDNVAPDTTVTVHVVSDIPAGEADGNISSGTLTAIANSDGSGGAANDYTESGADTPGVVDTVLADAAGAAAGDVARDGAHSAGDSYLVVTATISVTKTSTVISDPFNLLVNPKAIPGATIEYCIQVSNSGSAAASNVIVTDAIPANTTYVAGSIVAGGTVTGPVCNADGVAEDDDAAGADETDPNGGSFAAGTVSTTVAGVGAGTTTTTIYRVTID